MNSQAPMVRYVPRPPKSRGTALVVEILPGLFGFYGFGWIYGGNVLVGVLLLIGGLVWDFLAIFVGTLTGGIACFCTVPVNLVAVAVSALMLTAYANGRPDLFGA